MFDVGFSEIILILVVALVVLGPERLPTAARYAGLTLRRIRAHWFSIKSEFENEIADEQLKTSLRETKAALRDAEQQLREQATEVENDVKRDLTDDR